MKLRGKKLVILMVAVLTVVTTSIFAWVVNLPPKQKVDENAFQVVNATATANGFELGANQSGHAFTLNLELLKDGGVRLYDNASCNDLFKEKIDGLKDEVISAQNGTVMTVTGKTSGVKAVLNYTNSSAWTLNIYNGGDTPVYSIGSSNVLVTYNGANRTNVSLKGTIDSGEQFIGLGERYTGTILNGKSYPMWNEDSWSAGIDGTKTTSYANVPLLHSSNGYSVFFNSFYNGTADIGATNSSQYKMDFAGPDLDIFLWTGTPLENVKSYMAVTGTTVTIPKWAVGYWAGGQAGTYWRKLASNYYSKANSGVTPPGNAQYDSVAEYYDEALKEVLENYESMGTTPAAVFGESIAVRNGMDAVSKVSADAGVKLLGWYHANEAWDDDLYRKIDASVVQLYCPDLVEGNYPLVKSLAGGGYYFATDKDGNATQWNLVDYTNVSAQRLVTAMLTANKAWTPDNGIGLSGMMVDYGEYIPVDTKFANGMTGEEMHNLQAYYYNKTMQEAWEGSNKKGDYILFARAGSAGSQNFAAQFGGDQKCNFEGLRQAVMGGLSASASGFGIWGSDIGGLGTGYSISPENPKLTAELYMRWLGFGTFSTLMRTHGSMDHDPWTFADEVETEGLGVNVEEVFKKYYWTRKNLADAIYSATLQSSKDGTPVMQVMGLANPDYFNVGDQYMFCNDMLVAPIYQQADSGKAGTVTKSVTFPEGTWYDLWTGQAITGTGTAQNITVKIDETPVYLRSGSVMPVDLSTGYEMATDMNGGSVQALLITPMENGESRTSTWYIGEDANAPAFTYKSISDDGVYRILAQQNAGNPRVLKTYGIATEKVYVDGMELERLDHVPSSAETGFYVDESTKEMVIVLGNDNWEQISFQDTDMIQYVEYTAEQFAAYRSESGFTAPTLEGYLFAGWFYDELGENQVSADVTTASSVVYAKFVPKSVLNVGAQVSANLLDKTPSNDTTASIRFVTTVDTLNYEKVGFKISYNKGSGVKTKTVASGEVYTKLFAEVGNEAGGTVSYNPTEFSPISTYFKACTVEEVNESLYDMKFTVTPFWITVDGTEVRGAAVEQTIEQYRESK